MLYQGEPKVKYQGRDTQVATRVVLVHKPGEGVCVREQVEVRNQAGRFISPEYNEMGGMAAICRAINARVVIAGVLLGVVVWAVVCGG